MNLLKRYIQEALVLELRRDDAFINVLKMRSGIGTPRTESGLAARKIASNWISDIELELGHPVPPTIVPQVNRFVAARWKGLFQRYRDERAAVQTMNNLLDAKFNSVRLADPR